jgi:DNA polymerase III delta prime subunit
VSKDSPVDKILVKIETIQDLIRVGQLFENEDFRDRNYSVNVEGLFKMIPALTELNEMVGQEKLKQMILDQIVYLCQPLHNQFQFKEEKVTETAADQDVVKFILATRACNKRKSFKKYKIEDTILGEDNEADMFHTVLYGDPGLGKTAIAKILARIFMSLDITRRDVFKVVTRTDLIGEYVGHTAGKVMKICEECEGGVLFIDEASALSNSSSDRENSFEKEAANALNQFMSEKKKNIVVILAGYEEGIKNGFFKLNPGLNRRFPFQYHMEKYDWRHLTDIFRLKVEKQEWTLSHAACKWLIESQFIKDKMELFPHYAGDVETWLLYIKLCHSRRIFGKDCTEHKIVTKKDIIGGLTRYKQHRTNHSSNILNSMYA